MLYLAGVVAPKGTLIVRPRKTGSTAYLAQILVKRDGAIPFRQSKTFDVEPLERYPF
jgi:hypothetical protein